MKLGEISKKNNLNWNLLSQYRSELMGVAAILILVFHSIFFCFDLYNGQNIIANSLYVISSFLNVGVEIFLIVSGIGLYYSYEKRPSFKDYYCKRLVNVYLMLVIIRIFFNTLEGILFGFKPLKDSVIGYLGLNYIFGIDNTDWYVSFIMIMYLLFPLIYKFVKKIENSKWFGFIATLIPTILVAIILLIKDTEFYNTYEVGISRVPIFFIGCCLGSFFKNKKNISIFIYGIALIGMVLKILRVSREVEIYSRLSSILFVFSVLVVVLIMFRFLPNSILKFLKFIGGMSLELYIIHGILYTALLNHYENYRLTWVYILSIVVAFLLSIVFCKFRNAMVLNLLKSNKRDTIAK